MRARCLLIGVVSVVLATGCSSAPSAREWASDVCAAVQPWRHDVRALSEETGETLASSTPEQVRDQLTELLSDTSEATETARRAVVDAGVPDVENGEAIAARFVDSLTAARDAYRTARDGIGALDADSPAFYDDVAEVMDTLNSDYADIPQVSQLNSDELRDAFDEVEACQGG